MALEFRRRTDRRSAHDDMVVLAVPPWVATELLPGPDRARRIPRHRQRAFQDRRRLPARR